MNPLLSQSSGSAAGGRARSVLNPQTPSSSESQLQQYFAQLKQGQPEKPQERPALPSPIVDIPPELRQELSALRLGTNLGGAVGEISGMGDILPGFGLVSSALGVPLSLADPDSSRAILGLVSSLAGGTSSIAQIPSVANAIPGLASLTGNLAAPITEAATQAGALAGTSSAAQGAMGPALQGANLAGQALPYIPLAADLANIGLSLSGGGKEAERGAITGAMSLAANLALPGAGLLYSLGPFLTSGLGNLIFGPEKESAQSRWQNEQTGNRINFATAMSLAESPADIAGVFNAFAGRGYSPADVVQPGFLSTELGGELFNQSAGGSSGNISAYSLFDALRRLAPADSVAQAKELVAGYGRPSRAALVEQARQQAEYEGLVQLFNPSSVPAPKGRFQGVWENLERLPNMEFPDIEGASPEPLFNIWKRAGAPGFNTSYREWQDRRTLDAQGQANALFAGGSM